MWNSMLNVIPEMIAIDPLELKESNMSIVLTISENFHTLAKYSKVNPKTNPKSNPKPINRIPNPEIESETLKSNAETSNRILNLKIESQTLKSNPKP